MLKKKEKAEKTEQAKETEQAKKEGKAKKKDKTKKTGKEDKEKVENEVDAEQSATQEEEIHIIKDLVELILYTLFVIAVVWFIITFVGQRTEVSGSSMYDTLENGDNLWVNKMAYRFSDPERFDIVVFPHDEDEDTQVYYIKRIIGLPGERIRIEEDGTIYINNEPLEEEYGYETINPATIGRAKSNIILGEDEYFVMGDNRNNSSDSRTEEVGNIKREDLEGKAVFRIWPLSKFGTID